VTHESEPADLAYWVGFQLIPGVGPARIARLRQAFGDLERAWDASSSDLARAGIDGRLCQVIAERRRGIDPSAEIAKIQRHDVTTIASVDSRYPDRLRQIDAAPAMLFARGKLESAGEKTVAVVGTRRPTAYGRQITERLVIDLVQAGVTIVSGLARGIDSVAHRVTIDAGGRTVAVLGCGLDINYPPENASLSRQIVASGGAVISEYPLGTGPDAGNFPARNRIISGLSLGTLVIEAGEISGALITARVAAEQGRDVFAVPGPITSPASIGTHRLIQDGAKLVTGINDILEELDLGRVEQQLVMRDLLPANDVEASLLRVLSHQPTHIDDVCRATTLAIATVSSTLSMMDLKGMVRQMGSMTYVLT
jgi:DNA processing protein